ncbi:MAG: hypothetical protein ACU83O_13135 [Gammaproteobacteria bacterium]
MRKLLIINPRSMASQMAYIHYLNYLAENAPIELYLICESIEKKLLNEKISIIEIPRYRGRFLFAIELYRAATKLIIDRKIDWVLSSYGHFNSLLVLFTLKARLKKQWNGTLFYDIRSASVSGVMDWLQNRLFSFESLFYDRLISHSMGTAIKVFGKRRAKDCFVLGIGSFPKRHFENEQIRKKVDDCKRKYQIDEKTLVFVYIGTLSHRELDIFLDGFCFDDNNYRFFIIGEGSVEAESRIKSVVKEKKLSHFYFLGRLPFYELPVYLFLADIGVAYAPCHDSLCTQPFTKILEYAEFNVLVLASDNLSENETVQSAEVVYLSSYKSVSVIRSFLDKNRDKLYRQNIKKVYWDEIGKQFYDYLNQFSHNEMP